MEHPQPDGARRAAKVKELAARLRAHDHHHAKVVAEAYGLEPPPAPKEDAPR